MGGYSSGICGRSEPGILIVATGPSICNVHVSVTALCVNECVCERGRDGRRERESVIVTYSDKCKQH